MEYSGAGGKLIHKKTKSKKSSDTVPLSLFPLSIVMMIFGRTPCHTLIPKTWAFLSPLFYDTLLFRQIEDT
jgi:hypothetical protein